MQASSAWESCVFDELKDHCGRGVTSKGKNTTKGECFILLQSFILFQLNTSNFQAAKFCQSFTFHPCLASFPGTVVQSCLIYAIFQSQPNIRSSILGAFPKFWIKKGKKFLLPSTIPTHASAHTPCRISLALHHDSTSTFLPDKLIS